MFFSPICLVKNVSSYLSIKEIFDLFKHRENWLEEKLKKEPKFSWSMPNANVPNHKNLEEFLRSDAQKMMFSFTSIKDAREFADNYNGNGDGYSIKTETGGVGSDFYVTITKTKEYYESCLKTLDKYRAELAKIRSYSQFHFVQGSTCTCL